jgi:hypothetical protein
MNSRGIEERGGQALSWASQSRTSVPVGDNLENVFKRTDKLFDDAYYELAALTMRVPGPSQGL